MAISWIIIWKWMTQANIHHVCPRVTPGSKRPHPLRNSHSCSGSPHQSWEHLLSPSVWAKSPEAASGKFEQMWPTVTLTKNGFSSLCCPKAKEIRSRSYKILDQRIPEPECLMLADSNTDHCNGHFLLFLLSKDPAITFTTLPIPSPGVFSSKVWGQMLDQPSPPHCR